jgi:hypothetical protein
VALLHDLRRAGAGLAVLALAGVLAGCGNLAALRYDPGPRFTVSSFLLYLKLRAYPSAWQELSGTIQHSGPALLPSPLGTGVTASMGWSGYPAFRAQARQVFKAFLGPLRLRAQRSGETATVLAQVPGHPGLEAGFRLDRVDNEWLIHQILIAVPGP